MNTISDKSVISHNAMPLYLQVKDSIRRRILSKEWKSGSRIPIESELCDMYGVSRITVRKALESLQSEGYLIKLQGRGTFVNKNTIEQRLSKFYSFSGELQKKGMHEHAKLISFSKTKADEEQAENLRCQIGDPVYRIERVRCTEDKPYAVEVSYIPLRFAPGLTEEPIKSGLYRALNAYGVYPDTATEQFSAINVNAETASLLGVHENDAAISLRRTTFSGTNLVEYCTSIVRGDFFSYTVELT
jgi:GntR family transcriptional regulator